MIGRLFQPEQRFFPLFDRLAARIVETSEVLVKLLTNYADENARQAGINRIELLEREADQVVSEAIELLRKTIKAPFDRETIHALLQGMDDIVDLMHDVAETLLLFDIQTITRETHQLADLVQMCCERLFDAVVLLNNLEQGQQILAMCNQIDRLESDADRVMRAAMSKLFREEPDVRELIKRKSVYELLESVTDRCEDVSELIQGLVLEHA
jgi:uncharacterized protein Yka (UPF0111/DUF47 family)